MYGKFVSALAFVLVGVTLFPAETRAQNADPADSIGRLAPPVPARSLEETHLLVREVPFRPVWTGRPMRIVRYGFGGTLERPNEIELPEEGTMLVPQPYDWIRAVERDIEIRLRDRFRFWATVKSGTQAIILSSRRIELLVGTIHWRGTVETFTERVVSAGTLTFRGRGGATIARERDRVVVMIEGGSFDVFRDGAPVAVLGAGQSRSFNLAETDHTAENEREQLQRGTRRLGAALDTALQEAREGAIAGSRLSEIWEAVVTVAPLYAAAEERTVAWIDEPDLLMNDIGEALRVLAMYGFTPPSTTGM